MRTRSEPKPPALKGRRAFSGSTAMTPSTAARPSSRPPLPRSTSSAAPRPPTSLSRSGSSTSLSTLPNTTTTRSPHSSATSQPSSNRPSSAAGLVERLPRPERRGPPPAPSTAARNRVRARTASLRTTASNGDLRGAAAVGMSTPAGARRPPRLDTTRDQPQLGTAVLSPVPMTPSTPSTTSRPPTLRSRRSQGNLLATPSTAGGGARTMERKRSLQSLPKLELTQGTPVASTSTASRRALRSPTPSTPGTATTSFFSPSSSPTFTRTTTPSTSSRFAAPTASSISRVRERVSSNPVLPPSPLTSTATSFSHLTHPPRPSSAASGRLLQPTASSAAKASPRLPSSASFNSPIAGLRIPSAALKLAKPKKQRAYGDGTELDGFDDLPLTKGERERERTVSQSMRRSSAGAASKGAGGTVKPTASERRSQNRSSGSAGSGGAKEGGSTIKAKPSRSTSAGGSTIKASSSSKLAPPSIAATGSKRLKAESAEEGIEKKSRMAGEEKARRKKEPQLIRNLGAPGMAKVGDMTWNPLLHRWEGNESVLRDFDKALSSSTRPALITQLSSGLSPARVGFPSLSKPIITSSSESATTSAGEETSATSPATSLLSLTPSSHPLRHGSTSSTLSAPNVKVVGSMVFDPVRMSWHSISPEGEDELDLMFEGGDWADDEGDGAGSGRAPSALGRVMGEDGDDDGWAMGEKERMLKNRASFVLSESGDGESDAEGQEGEVRRALRESCEEGEKRCREEFERWGWTSREKDGEEEEMRNDLWNIRELIMDNRSPPRR
ncbi:hypothetical protein BCR35DRAFT_160663 [Leucosporidium creatinivorum]|uniref:Uncharacterized protein n=1 Tax=Leucosporidium creatinivorum TaxID=106004 RepID=A0A1Y2EME5_9BASI|nr:hypothetical protein BCR35DRAFT_160663 [Leucosporidium creatinivorum]